MSRLILPQRFTRQPQNPVAIDRSNAFGRSVVNAIIPINGVMTDVAANFRLTKGTSPTFTQGNSGVARVYPGTTAGMDTAAGTANVTTGINSTYTVYCLVATTDVSSGNFIWSFGGNGGTSYMGLRNAGAATSIQPSYGGGTNVTYTGVTNWADGNPHGIATVFYTTNDYRTFIDGSQVGATTAGIAFPTGYTWVGLGGLNRNSAELPTSSKVYALISFNRALSPNELTELHRNPWQVFDAPARQLWLASTGSSLTQFTEDAWDWDDQIDDEQPPEDSKNLTTLNANIADAGSSDALHAFFDDLPDDEWSIDDYLNVLIATPVAQPSEDAFFDDDCDDEWWHDDYQQLAIVVAPQLPDDLWLEDDIEDEWVDNNSPSIDNNPVITVDDQHWWDDFAEDDWQEESSSLADNNPLVAVSHEWDFDDPGDDDWWVDEILCASVAASSQFMAEDWQWDDDSDDEFQTDSLPIAASVVAQQVYSDDWLDEDVDDDWLCDEAQQPVIQQQPVADEWPWDEVEDNLWLDDQQLYVSPISALPFGDEWDWDEQSDDEWATDATLIVQAFVLGNDDVFFIRSRHVVFAITKRAVYWPLITQRTVVFTIFGRRVYLALPTRSTIFKLD